ncbi:MAG: hypothetical protein L6Q98_09025 [Anaerolineae bacterium]|nr:hypothetical protein [Anaerolineae bacterium]NUQ03842.1 hypothetical protein [Anaerolineae bacterium]
MFRRGGDSRNSVVGLMLIVALLFFAPRYLPNLVANVVPELYEGAPCDRLRLAEDRANHQSLLGRAATAPISLTVRTGALPSDPSGILYVTIAVVNNTVGTVPFVFDPQRVIVGDNNTSGLGISFNPAKSIPVGIGRQDSASVPETSIRLLQPRQRCLFTVEIPGGNVLSDSDFVNGGVEVTAFYRNNINGAITTSPIPQATPVFTDQGLWTGFVQSAPVRVPGRGG